MSGVRGVAQDAGGHGARSRLLLEGIGEVCYVSVVGSVNNEVRCRRRGVQMQRHALGNGQYSRCGGTYGIRMLKLQLT
jgi:hypothetical protein